MTIYSTLGLSRTANTSLDVTSTWLQSICNSMTPKDFSYYNWPKIAKKCDDQMFEADSALIVTGRGRLEVKIWITCNPPPFLIAVEWISTTLFYLEFLVHTQTIVETLQLATSLTHHSRTALSIQHMMPIFKHVKKTQYSHSYKLALPTQCW